MPPSIVAEPPLKPTVQELFARQGVHIGDVVRSTGLSAGAIHRAVYGGNHRINEGVSEAIARFLGLSVTDIAWPQKLTHIGRPALATTTVHTVSKEIVKVCPSCFLELPVNGICPSCDTP